MGLWFTGSFLIFHEDAALLFQAHCEGPRHWPIGVVDILSLNIYTPGFHRFSHFPQSSLNIFKPTSSVKGDQHYCFYIMTQIQKAHICITKLLVALIIAARVPAAPDLLWLPWARRILTSALHKLLRTFEAGKIFLRLFPFQVGFIFQVTLSRVPWELSQAGLPDHYIERAVRSFLFHPLTTL